MRSFNLTATTQQRYITKVRIENFQSHEDTEFDLSPGINVIVGSSEAGKSAILRAINFVLHNEPRGDDFVRVERDETRVSIWWNDGCYLCRIKGENRNAVLVKDKDGYEQGYERIGNTLPTEALAVLGFPPIDDESGPIAYADQHQPLFLVTLSASELPRTISRLTGIDDFEEAAEVLNKKANAANRQIKDSTKRIEGYNLQLKNYDKLDDKLKRLEEMEKLSVTIDDISNHVAAARRLKVNYDELMQMGRVANAALHQAGKLAALSGQLTPVKAVVGNIAAATRLSKEYETLVSLESRATKSLEVAETIANAHNTKLLKEVKEKTANIRSAKLLKTQYDELMDKGRKLNGDIAAWTTSLTDLQEKQVQLVAEMKEAGLWCSVCQRPKSVDACEK